MKVLNLIRVKNFTEWKNYIIAFANERSGNKIVESGLKQKRKQFMRKGQI